MLYIAASGLSCDLSQVNIHLGLPSLLPLQKLKPLQKFPVGYFVLQLAYRNPEMRGDSQPT